MEMWMLWWKNLQACHNFITHVRKKGTGNCDLWTGTGKALYLGQKADSQAMEQQDLVLITPVPDQVHDHHSSV